VQENTKKTMHIFWRYTMRYRWSFLITIFSLLIAAILTAATPVYLKKIIDT
jgi:ABC-type bacteriocin/lantibiotic exporter with double-glycine peptidase domain